MVCFEDNWTKKLVSVLYLNLCENICFNLYFKKETQEEKKRSEERNIRGQRGTKTYTGKGVINESYVYNNIISLHLLIYRGFNTFSNISVILYTCEPSGGSIFLPILRVTSVPPVNFQNLPPVKKIKYNKILTYILRSIFLVIPHLELPCWEIRMVKVNVIFNDIRLLICLTPLQVNWVMVIN